MDTTEIDLRAQANIVVDRLTTEFGLQYTPVQREALVAELMELAEQFPADMLNDGAALISKERGRQKEEEAFSTDHDDQWENGELSDAAIAYVLADKEYLPGEDGPEFWPWGPGLWKPKGRISNLVKAGALISAEIDRLKRLDVKK